MSRQCGSDMPLDKRLKMIETGTETILRYLHLRRSVHLEDAEIFKLIISSKFEVNSSVHRLTE